MAIVTIGGRMEIKIYLHNMGSMMVVGSGMVIVKKKKKFYL